MDLIVRNLIPSAQVLHLFLFGGETAEFWVRQKMFCECGPGFSLEPPPFRSPLQSQMHQPSKVKPLLERGVGAQLVQLAQADSTLRRNRTEDYDHG